MTGRTEFLVGHPASVEVRLPAGRIEVLPGPQGRIAVDVGGRDADRVIVEQIGDTVGIRHDDAGPPLRSSQVAVSIEAPPGCSLQARLATAGVTSRADLGSVRIKSASGGLRLGSASSVEISTASGDVWVDHARERCQISTASGDVHIGTIRSGGEVSTASGDLRVGVAGSSVAVTSVSGDMRIERFEGDDLTVSTVSGDVSVAMVPGRRVSVDLTTLSGRIDLPESPGSPEGPPSGPHTQLRFRSISGDLRVTRARPDEGRVSVE